MKDYRRYHCDENKLTDYGFKKQGHNYIYKKNILHKYNCNCMIKLPVTDLMNFKRCMDIV